MASVTSVPRLFLFTPAPSLHPRLLPILASHFAGCSAL